MIGNDSMFFDISNENLWRSWKKYSAGKKYSIEQVQFHFHLEAEIFDLHRDLANGSYIHGGYRKFVVTDNKRRMISVASMRDRLVHRMAYDFLVNIYDSQFDYDIWSCRKNKGLHQAVKRARFLLGKNKNEYFWRFDIRKFFESVDQQLLFTLVKKRITDPIALRLLSNIIFSYHGQSEGKGMPIGNLTSQIFGNIYLNELDRFIRHQIKPLGFVRYGDDYLLIFPKWRVEFVKNIIIKYIVETLMLQINPSNQHSSPVSQGVKFLGCMIYTDNTRLTLRNKMRIIDRISQVNTSSYWGLMKEFDDQFFLEYPYLQAKVLDATHVYW